MIFNAMITALIWGLAAFTVPVDGTSSLGCNCERRFTSCGPVPYIPNGQFDPCIPHGLFFGDEAKLVCNQGFEESEPTTITCQSNGEWSSFTATCDVITFGGTYYVQIFPRVTQVINGDVDERRLFLTCDDGTHINVTSAFTSLSQMYTCANGFQEIVINKAFDLEVSGVVNNKVIEIRSDNPINVHGFSYVDGRSPSNQPQIATEAWLARPVDTCSSEYVIITTEQAAQFNIVGLVDGTNCTITDIADIQLDSLQVYTFFVDSSSPADKTGTIIECTNDVCVWSGGWFSQVPLDTGGTRDMNTVQLLGVDRWPNKCVFGRFEPREEFEIKVVASMDNTNVVIDKGAAGQTNVNLNRGDAVDQFYNLAANVEAVLITADKPFLAAQFSVKRQVDNANVGDSSMIQCVDPDNFQSRYVFQLDNTDNDEFDEYRLRLVINETKADQLRLDNMVLSPATDKDVTFSSTGEKFTFITIEVFEDTPYEVKTLDGTPFGADAYGKRRVAQFTKSLGQLYDS